MACEARPRSPRRLPILTVGLFIASLVVGIVGMLQLPLWLGYVVVIILCITNAVSGKRFLIPGLSDFAQKF